MKMQVVKRNGSHKLNDDQESQAVYEVLTDLYNEHGELTAEHVVAEACDEDSPLHTHFQWDDEKAAHSHRLKQARDLIGSVEIKRVKDDRADENGRINAFVNVTRTVSDDDGNEVKSRTYVPTIEAMSDEEMSQQVLKQGFFDLCAWERRYGSLKEFAAVCGAIEDCREALEIEVVD